PRALFAADSARRGVRRVVVTVFRRVVDWLNLILRIGRGSSCPYSLGLALIALNLGVLGLGILDAIGLDVLGIVLDHRCDGQRQRRDPGLHAGLARHRQPEAGAHPGLADGVQHTAVQLGVLPGDRQAKARAAGPALAGWVRAPEAVEHHLL